MPGDRSQESGVRRQTLDVRWQLPDPSRTSGLSLLASGISLLISLAGCGPAERPPNVLLVIVDDLGWRDLGVYGSTFYETPAIDALAAEGVRFTQFYAASPVCSPTRASIMTGKHPARLRITNWIGGEQDGLLRQAEYERQLPLEEYTIGEAFRDAGYATGYIGKWHLGVGAYMPDAQGFQTTVAVNEAGQPSTYFYPYQNARTPQMDVPDLEDGVEGDYLTDRLTDEALAFIDVHASEPFFLVLSHYAVHTPLQAPEEQVAKYRDRAEGLAEGMSATISESGRGSTTLRQEHPVYAAMVESVDRSVARLTARLDERGLGGRTIVVLVSDNGGLSTIAGEGRGGPTSNEPLRAGKGWLYEGGIRIPFIVRWRDRLPSGLVTAAPGVTMDLFPTLLELAGLPPRPGQHVDGVSLTRVLAGSAEPFPRTLPWHFPHYHGSGNVPSGAVRAGNLKLVEWFETGEVELYDLAADSGETVDVAPVRPAEADSLRAWLMAWRNLVGAAMPTVRPDSQAP
jgi:arylsulfatase A